IFRTQVACGISAKVILVTLQKEQGLVLKKAPSDSALRWAMGMACPDTAPCNTAFAGLGTQIVTGTRQLKVYKAANFARQPGTNFIGWHPNSDCGGTYVNVQNYATAALYNYTPYQPNAAALANMNGTGDSCSSYGNRNFWRFYTQWFGSTVDIPCTVNPNSQITRLWESEGGATGSLGAAVSPGFATGPGGVAVGYYANGNIYCTPQVGPVAVIGELRVKYEASGGAASAIGAPVSARTAFSAGGVSGFLQNFQRGFMMSSVGTGTFAVLNGAMRTAWGDRGGSGGALGWPTGDQESVAVGIRQQFQNGLLVVPTGQASVVLAGEIGNYWSGGSRPAVLGSPTASQVAWVAGGVTGSLQYFQRGMVLSSVTTGTFSVLDGPVRDVWGNRGGSGGSLGWPTGDQESISGGVRQQFQGGVVIVPSGGVGAVLAGEIATYWAAGSNASKLGSPTGSPASWVAGGVTGTLQYFQRGMVLSSASTGTFAVLDGPIRNAWGARGGSGGALGWPTGDQESVSGGVRQQFQGGQLSLDTGLSGEIAAYWGTGSNASRLGSAKGSQVAWVAGGVTGSLQYFQRGMVLSSVTTGTFSVLDGPVRDVWGNRGGSGGSLGWPTGDQESISGGVRQQFQGGVVIVPSGGVGAVLAGEIATYWAAGSNASKLGSPTGSPASWVAGGVTGTLQYFQRGMVLSSASTGTFAVLDGPIRNAWGARGGSGGALGWPTGDQESVSGGVRQQFQGGSLVAPTSGSSISLTGEIAAYWAAGSNKSLLGAPTASATETTAGGITGTIQLFERGTVLSSTTTGTFAVLNGPIRSAWTTQGGAPGALGWPTGEQAPSAGGLRQAFHLGGLVVSASGTATPMTVALYAYWTSGSNSSLLGSPVASAIEWTAGGISGTYQVFASGMVMSSTETGTFAVLDGKIRDHWGSLGGSGGTLGWPIADQQPSAEGARQQFQHGAVIAPPTGVPYVEMD
ncbi:MAG: hypothetical protein ACOH1J_08660, partial [Microbacteriaceae bacterium]